MLAMLTVVCAAQVAAIARLLRTATRLLGRASPGICLWWPEAVLALELKVALARSSQIVSVQCVAALDAMPA